MPMDIRQFKEQEARIRLADRQLIEGGRLDPERISVAANCKDRVGAEIQFNEVDCFPFKPGNNGDTDPS